MIHIRKQSARVSGKASFTSSSDGEETIILGKNEVGIFSITALSSFKVKLRKVLLPMILASPAN